MFEINIATLFSGMCDVVLSSSIIGRAIRNELVNIKTHNIRDYTLNKHKKVDDAPYGGGRGMLMQAEPIYRCYKSVSSFYTNKLHVVFLSPKGSVFSQSKALELLNKNLPILFICGHYEGVDQRLIDEIVDEEISIGDYVITGGELAALVVIDSVVRLIPGVLKSNENYEIESHFSGLLEYPQYTRPRIWRGRSVPEVLVSGNHKKINDWRKLKSMEITKLRRPDLIN